MVLVAGEAGSGKTRLLKEFMSLARDDGATTLFGFGIEVSAGDLPFIPFRVALRHLVEDRTSAQMEEALGSAWQDLHVLLPEFAPSRQTSDSTAELPHVFEVVASVIAALSRDRHVVLAVDDAQWADQSTLQLLHYLNQAGQHLPLLVVAAYRGEELPADPARRKAFEELSRTADDVVSVSPLDREQVAELVRGIGVELSSSAMARLQTRSAGLPFLVEELVTAERDGVTRGIPRRVRDVVRLRLGGLSDPAQLVTALVAVAARPMRHRVLQEAAQLSNRVYAAALTEALAASLLVADTRDRSYNFRHDVAREIVHEDLLPASRLELHVRLAVALQSDLPVNAYASRLCEVAHHWLQTDANEEHALRAALLAARASTRAFAHPEALRQYDHVVRLWSRVHDPEVVLGVDMVDVSTESAEAARWAGDTRAAVRHIDRALAVNPAGDASTAAAVLRERRALYTWLESGRFQRDPETVLLSDAVATDERMRASDLMSRGRYAESVEHAERAVELARAAGSREEEVHAQVILGVDLAMSQQVSQGISLLQRAREDASHLQSTELIVSTHINLTFVLLSNGDAAEAADIALQGMAEVSRRGIGGSEAALIACNAAEALTRLGRLSEAERLLVDALDTTLPPAVESVLLLGRAEIEVLTGRFPAAERTLRAVADLAPLESRQFHQQQDAWEAELQLWDPANVHSIRLADLRGGLGSMLVDDDDDASEDPPLTARLMWLGLRADADAAARTAASPDDAGKRALVDDGTVLAARAHALSTSVTNDGMRRQVDGYLALIDAEESRLCDLPAPDLWQRAAASNTHEPYLRAYSLWQQGCALRTLRRRRDAGQALQEAYRVAEPVGMLALMDAITAAGISLNVRVDQIPQPRAPRPSATHPYNLTAKESEVLALLVQGNTNRLIASALHMTEKTASVHVSRILAKLSVRSRSEAVARAFEVGLATVPREY